MLASLKKYSTKILLLLVLLFLVVAWFYPSSGLLLGIGLLFLTLTMACIAVIQRQRKAYRQGEITHLIFMRNVSLESAGILLAAICAGFLGNIMALLATRSIADALIRFAVGVFVGLSIGIAIGAAIRKIWNRFFIHQ